MSNRGEGGRQNLDKRTKEMETSMDVENQQQSCGYKTRV